MPVCILFTEHVLKGEFLEAFQKCTTICPFSFYKLKPLLPTVNIQLAWKLNCFLLSCKNQLYLLYLIQEINI